jgi:hypothetical protein
LGNSYSTFYTTAGHRLPYNHRQKVHDNGTLEVYHIERATDEGLYTCIAKNKKGQTSQSSVYVRVQSKSINVLHIWCSLHSISIRVFRYILFSYCLLFVIYIYCVCVILVSVPFVCLSDCMSFWIFCHHIITIDLLIANSFNRFSNLFWSQQ